jgi:hypothetical protein
LPPESEYIIGNKGAKKFAKQSACSREAKEWEETERKRKVDTRGISGFRNTWRPSWTDGNPS